MIETFYTLKKETIQSHINKKIKESLKQEQKQLIETKLYVQSPKIIRNIRNIEATVEIRPFEEKKWENTPKKTNESILQESKQNLNLSEINDDEINQDRIETSRNSLSLAGNIVKRRVMTCGDMEKENNEVVVDVCRKKRQVSLRIEDIRIERKMIVLIFHSL